MHIEQLWRGQAEIPEIGFNWLLYGQKNQNGYNESLNKEEIEKKTGRKVEFQRKLFKSFKSPDFLIFQAILEPKGALFLTCPSSMKVIFFCCP